MQISAHTAAIDRTRVTTDAIDAKAAVTADPARSAMCWIGCKVGARVATELEVCGIPTADRDGDVHVSRVPQLERSRRDRLVLGGFPQIEILRVVRIRACGQADDRDRTIEAIVESGHEIEGVTVAIVEI